MTWIVEVTRTVRLELPASSSEDARVMALDAAWEWCPETAHRGDQGSAVARVVRAGDLPGGTLPPPVAAGLEVLDGGRREAPICPRGPHREGVLTGPWPRGAPPLERYTDGSGWACPGLLPDGSACGYERRTDG